MNADSTVVWGEVAATRESERPRREARRGRQPSRAAWRFFLFVLLAVAVLSVRPVSRHVRAAKLLVSFGDMNATSAVTESTLTIDVPASGALPARQTKARLFVPRGADVASTPAMVVVHGVQYRGIEEPRLQRFARAISNIGFVVLTPQLEELADYQVQPRTIETVGAAVKALRAKNGDHKVGLVGVSFGGGISLLTAADPRYAGDVSTVLALGGHDDLERVSRFFATDAALDPSGVAAPMHAHEYGATVLVYTHAEDFFPTADVPAARDALRFWLWEEREAARREAAKLSPESKAKVEKLFAADIASVRQELLAEIEKKKDEMKLVSPHDRLGGMRASVYVLHGAGDTVIPATEALWLGKDVPPARLRSVLVSPAIQHVELKEPKVSDKAELVHFMGRLIGDVEDGR